MTDVRAWSLHSNTPLLQRPVRPLPFRVEGIQREMNTKGQGTLVYGRREAKAALKRPQSKR